MAIRLFAVIFVQTCLYHVVRPSSYVEFTTSGEPKPINRLDIRTLYPGFHSTTGFTGPYGPNIESASRHLNQVFPSQILSTDPLSRIMGRNISNPSQISNCQIPSQRLKMLGSSPGGFIRGIFQAADNNRRMTTPIRIGPDCGVSESGGSYFHKSLGSNESGQSFSGWSSDIKCSNDYDELARYCVLESKSESASSKGRLGNIFSGPCCNHVGLASSHSGLRSSVSESVSSKGILDSNLGGSCCNYGESTSIYSGLGSNGGSASSKAKSNSIFCKPYSNSDASTSRNSQLERNVGESVSSKDRSDSNLALEELVSSKSRSGRNIGGSCSYGSTSSHDSNNRIGRMGRYGVSDHGAVGVAGKLPVVGRTTVVGRVPITGGVKFNGFIPASGRVTIGGSCFCGPPFAL